MKSLLIPLFALCAAAVVAPDVRGQTIAVPATINYQGLLADATGKPVPDGNTNVVFRLYGAQSGGSSLWGPKTNSVAVVGGAFNTLVGGADTANPSRDFSATLMTVAQTPNASAFLEVGVGGTTVVPRQQILSAPYALAAGNAGKLNGFSWADLLGVENPVSGQLDGSKIKNGSIGYEKLTSNPGTVVVSEEVLPTRLRIVRGSLNDKAAIEAGSGFTARLTAGPFYIYVITYTKPFSGPPTVVVTVDNTEAAVVVPRVDNSAGHPDATFIEFHPSTSTAANPIYATSRFNFIAIGPE